jgi:hypothetical protein
METKKKSNPLPILPSKDFLQALVRSEAYLDDYAAHAESLAEWEFNDPLPDGADVVAARDEVWESSCNSGHTLGSQALAAGKSFLRRWPMLLHPIPPHRAMENPDEFLAYLCAPVEVLRSPAGGVRGEIMMGVETSGRLVFGSDIRDGRFLVVKIDATRSKEDIIEALGHEIDRYRQTDWGLPPVNARKSTPKRTALNLSSRKWETFDAYTSAGGDVQETAEALFPYDKRKAKREAKAEAEAFLEKKGGRKALRGKDYTEYERLLKARATPATIKRRDAIEHEIRRIVKDCESRMEAIKPEKP